MLEVVIEYIANSCQNDVRHIEVTINRLMAYTAMMVPKKITLEFATEALNDYVVNNIYADNSIGGIQKAVADYFKITVDDLKSKKRNAKVVKPRHIAMYILKTKSLAVSTLMFNIFITIGFFSSSFIISLIASCASFNST